MPTIAPSVRQKPSRWRIEPGWSSLARPRIRCSPMCLTRPNCSSSGENSALAKRIELSPMFSCHVACIYVLLSCNLKPCSVYSGKNWRHNYSLGSNGTTLDAKGWSERRRKRKGAVGVWGQQWLCRGTWYATKWKLSNMRSGSWETTAFIGRNSLCKQENTQRPRLTAAARANIDRKKKRHASIGAETQQGAYRR